jgi:DNA polymerase (family 10)
MDKEQVAGILDEIGTLLELQGENSFKCNAYHNASRTINQLETNLAELVRDGRLGELPGIGDKIKEKITTLVTTGHLPYYDELKSKTPEGLLEILRLPGVGPKKVKVLYEQLGIDDLAKLKAACDADQIAGLKGFGAKTQQKILEGIAFLGQSADRVRLDQAVPLAMALLEGMRGGPGIQHIELCGSLRRRKETIKDIDILISSAHAAPLMGRFVKLPQVQRIIAQGETKSSIVVAGPGDGARPLLMNADLRIVENKNFPFALNYFTGSKEHNIALRGRALDRGLKLNEYELSGPKGAVRCKDEVDLYRALDLAYVEPEMRENTGEIEAAEAGELPRLVEAEEIQGVFHCHTNWSDGAATLEEMVHAAKKLGLKYLGLGDHSQSLTVANGLTPARVREQHAAIDALSRQVKGIKLFKGIECDILADGNLDYDDDVLASFDYVVASVHSHFNQPQDEMTSRMCRALRHPSVTMLGHPTGRLLLRREGYPVDLEAVLQEAAKHHKMIEINAHPMRLDLDWVHCKRAKALGVKLVINPDAHSTADLAYYRYGVDVARRGWLEKKDVFNTLSAAQVAKQFGV